MSCGLLGAVVSDYLVLLAVDALQYIYVYEPQANGVYLYESKAKAGAFWPDNLDNQMKEIVGRCLRKCEGSCDAHVSYDPRIFQTSALDWD